MRRLYSILLFLSALCAPGVAESQTAAPPEFSADLIMTNKGQPLQRGKFFMGNRMARMELTAAGQVQILRMDKDVVWSILPNTKSYMEMPLQFNALATTQWPGFSESCVGEEVVEGHPTKKCVITGRALGQEVTSTVWKAQDLGGTVIRNIGSNGFGMELRQIVRGPQPAALFEPPANFKKATIPIGVGDLMKGTIK